LTEEEIASVNLTRVNFRINVTTRQNSSIAIVFILGLLAMLMPLSIDMYLPRCLLFLNSLVPAGSAQMTLSTYILGLQWGSCSMGQWQTALDASQ
jgi:DHA1 family bicyclomycin/chloramphenicol resistance-like MFS transporter